MKKIVDSRHMVEARMPDFNKPEPTAEEVYACPVCKFNITKDVSPRSNNGIIGLGYVSWKLLDARVCKNCGALFMPMDCNKVKL